MVQNWEASGYLKADFIARGTASSRSFRSSTLIPHESFLHSQSLSLTYVFTINIIVQRTHSYPRKRLQAAMSTIGSYLIYLISVIANSVIVTLGMMASIGIPWALLGRLRTISSPSRRESPDSQNDMASDHHSTDAFWDGVLGVLLTFTSTGYAGSCYYFWVELNSVIEAALKSTFTIVAVSVGIALSAGMVLFLGRQIGWWT